MLPGTGFEDIELPGGALRYYPGFVAQTDALFAALRGGIDWQQPELSLFGRRHKTPRLVSFVGEPGLSYRYSGHRHLALPWPAALLPIRERLAAMGWQFNCALLNYYRDGQDSMGYHSDDEPELGPQPVVASLSLGSQRDFLLRPKPSQAKSGGRQTSRKLLLQDGSLLLMLPPTQQHWQHALPRRQGLAQARINITFRQIIATAVAG